MAGDWLHSVDLATGKATPAMQFKGVSGVRDIAILPAMWRQIDVMRRTHRLAARVRSTTWRAPRSHFPVNVDLDAAGKHRAPGLQIDLHARIAGELLAVQLHRLRCLVVHLLQEAVGVVHVLQTAAPAPPRTSDKAARSI